MDDAQGVQSLEGLGDPGCERPQRRALERAVRADMGAQGGTGDVLGREPRARRLGIGVEETRDAGALRTSDQGDFAGEARAEVGVLGQFAVDDLHRRRLLLGSERGEHGTHAAGSEAAEKTEGADGPGIVRTERGDAGGRGHGRLSCGVELSVGMIGPWGP